MEASQLANVVGTGAALCSMTSFAPQILKIWRERDASSVSLRMYIVTVTGFALWIAYGVLIGSWPVMGANAVCLVMSATILALKWRFSRRGKDEAALASRGPAP
jgi:MtN3 and saliva related transmembrane protein